MSVLEQYLLIRGTLINFDNVLKLDKLFIQTKAVLDIKMVKTSNKKRKLKEFPF